MPTLSHVGFDLQPDDTIQCNFRYDDGPTTSFDVAQLPDKLKQVLGDLATSQQSTITQLQSDAAAAASAAQTQVANLQSELAASQANTQQLLAQIAELQAQHS